MTSLELLLALADEETLEFARRMIGKPRLALLLAKAAIETDGGVALDADAVAEILGVHKRHAYRLKKSKTCQMEKKSRSSHKRSQKVRWRVTERRRRTDGKKTCVSCVKLNENYLRSQQTNREVSAGRYAGAPREIWRVLPS